MIDVGLGDYGLRSVRTMKPNDDVGSHVALGTANAAGSRKGDGFPSESTKGVPLQAPPVRVALKWERGGESNGRPAWVKALRRPLGVLRIQWRQARYRFWLRYRYLVGRHRPDSLVFILAEGRSGSNLLASYFGGLPDVSMTEEILNRRNPIGLRSSWISKSAALRHIRYSMAMPGRLAVSKLAVHHLNWHNITPEDLCNEFPQARFVVLYRRDLLAQYVSWRLLYLTGQERFREGVPTSTETVDVDPQQFREFCIRMVEKYSKISRSPLLRERGCLLSYEELVDDPQTLFDNRIFPLLGLPSSSVVTQMKKQSSKPISEKVSNYEEIRHLHEDSQSTLSIEWPVIDETVPWEP